MIASNWPLDFTDGDTFKRFTVVDPHITSTTNTPEVSISRQPIDDVDDPGWTFLATVVGAVNGSFDVTVAALSWNEPAAAGEFPNETPTLRYSVQ